MTDSYSDVVLCADDYGMTRGIDRAILSLAAKQRISAISCIVTGGNWPQSAEDLRRIRGVEVGLHIVLSDGSGLTNGRDGERGGRFPGPWRVAGRALLGRIDGRSLAREIDAQIDRFAEGVGRYPDFVDGHQLVHQLPVISDALIETIAKRPRWRPWVRVCSDKVRAILQRKHGWHSALAASFLGRRLGRLARRAGVPVNRGFSGFYDVRHACRFPTIFPHFLRGLGPRHLIMCHPGLCENDQERSDVWMQNREHELEYFSSAAFLADLSAHKVRLQRFAQIADNVSGL
jgi:chitin disaccharide deacetylase